MSASGIVLRSRFGSTSKELVALKFDVVVPGRCRRRRGFVDDGVSLAGFAVATFLRAGRRRC